MHIYQWRAALRAGIGKPEDVGCVGNGNPAEGGAESGTQTAGGQATPRSTSPHAAAMLGQVGKATVAVSQADKVRSIHAPHGTL